MNAWKAGVSWLVVLVSLSFFSQVVFAVGTNDIEVKQWITKNPPNVKELNGKVTVIDFWATWCRPCRESIPHLRQLASKYRLSGVEVIGLSEDRDKTAEQLQEFVVANKINYHIAIDNGSADWFGIQGYPTIVILNHKGQLVWKGYPWDKQMETSIEKAVADAPPPVTGAVDLGMFSYLKKALFGGKNFAKAYDEIKSFVGDTAHQEKAVVASQVIQTIDNNISKYIALAENLISDNPLDAYNLYAELIKRYDGIDAVAPAKAEYLKLKNSEGIKNRILASDTVSEIPK